MKPGQSEDARHLKKYINYYYRVFNMETVDFKEILWLHFWFQAFLPIIFIVEKCVGTFFTYDLAETFEK